jgi:hypothetical protein
MSRHGIHGPDDAAWVPFRARGKPVYFTAHAYEGMHGERKPVAPEAAVRVLDEPDEDDGHEARKWVGWRTIRVYYEEGPDLIEVRGVSATRRRRPHA